MSKESTRAKLCDYIRREGKKRFKSNVEFADSCGVTEGTIRRITSGKYDITITTLEKISDAFGVKVSDMFREIGR